MDPALVAFDFTKAGAILADMVVSYLAAGAPPSNPEGPDEHDVQNRRSTPVAAGMHLHTPVDPGAGLHQSGEHRAAIQPDEQGQSARLEPGTDPGPRPRPRALGHSGAAASNRVDFKSLVS